MSLELAAMRWLWMEQKCLVVLQERTPKNCMGQPDVIGITPGRYMTEIEIKRSLADFRADALKPHRANRHFYLKSAPRLFYYLVPEKISAKVMDELPDWAGLMKLIEGKPVLDIVKRSPINPESTKLNVKQCAKLARQMTSHMMGFALANNSIKTNWKYGHFDPVDWVDCDAGTYSI